MNMTCERTPADFKEKGAKVSLKKWNKLVSDLILIAFFFCLTFPFSTVRSHIRVIHSLICDTYETELADFKRLSPVNRAEVSPRPLHWRVFMVSLFIDHNQSVVRL